MWSLYLQAKDFGCRPSDILAIEDRYVAFVLDNAVHHFGSALEGELKSIDGKTKREVSMKQQRVMATWLGLPMKYRNPGMVGPIDRNMGEVVESVVVKGEPTL